MGKNKLRHFAEMKEQSCVFEPEKETLFEDRFEMKGKWASFFGNDNPITVELGCGKGEYTLALARKYPERNFIGMDVKGARIWRGSKTAEEEGLPNVAFVRTKIEFINFVFEFNEVSEIWLTFSDPQVKDKKGTKRLSGWAFLKRYGKLLKKDGLIHVKTDSQIFYDSTLETIEEGGHQLLKANADIYGKGWNEFNEEEQEILAVKTFYEKKWLAIGKTIKYLRFKLNDSHYQDF
ncbi:MAG TPA: tRNA (guanosine(46)-N7)-methyltransferase TrmB [Cryomorphaceae bacterium]|nr:tRNA (guanosine(46)-N7)-methyltransferase TrmB [Cryomorphaceae bacterium]